MNIKDFDNTKLPDSSGVYFFLGEKGKILYIGKATSLQQRVRSYFSPRLSESRSVFIEQMVDRARSVRFQETDSVLEALILESNLIKKHKPKYNTDEKDDKSFNYLVITKEKFPRVEIVRKTDIKHKYSKKEIKYLFGPFPSGGLFQEAVKIIRKIFPFRDSRCIPSGEKGNKNGKSCFNKQIGLCFGACIGNSAKDYSKTVRHLQLFFEGKKSRLLKDLEKEMKIYAKKQEFEKADELKKKIFALNHIQDVALIKRDLISDAETFRIEGYDVAHFAGENRVGVMTVMENGEAKKSDYRKFNIQEKKNKGDGAALQEIIYRRFGHKEWSFPDLIVVDGGVIQVNAAKKALIEKDILIPVIGVVKDEKHQPKGLVGAGNISEKLKRNILFANSESHRFAISFHRKKRQRDWQNVKLRR
ncbi:MAG: GIY-YIG nuclease family protein [Patescibacteria group bacterium]|jgi:excinuclease ABC subunit C|nr:GIY-YIG nuclease family protein [Patescibacteria group bacterium]